MCIIAVSKAGKRQPTIAELVRCYNNNPDGAGYMYVKAGGDGKVHIRKGFMDVGDYIQAVYNEHFTDADAVVYHFRISTQAGVKPEMTHPFPVTSYLKAMKVLNAKCDLAVAHNGIISLTSKKDEKEYSDTALFVSGYLSSIYRHADELMDNSLLDLVEQLAGKNNKFALMNGAGVIETVGNFQESDGVLYSNSSYSKTYTKSWTYDTTYSKSAWNDYYFGKNYKDYRK